MTRTSPPPTSRFRAGVAGLLTVLLAGTLGIAASAPAGADDLEDQRRRAEAQQRATARAIEQLEGDLEDTDADLAAAYIELEGIEAEIEVAQDQLREAEEDLVRLELEAARIAEQLADAEAEEQAITELLAENTERADATRTAVGRMAREAYRGDMAASSLSAVLDAKSTAEFVEQSAMAATALRTQTQALRDLEQLNAVARNQQVRLVAVREEIARLKAEADAKVIEAEEARRRAEARTVELEELRAAAEEQAAFIESRRQEQIEKMAQLERQRESLRNSLQQIIRQQEEQRRREEEQRRREEERRRREASNGSGSSSGSSGSTGSNTSGTLPSSGRPLGYPVPPPPYITSSYGMRFHPILKYWRMHAGTDFRAYCGNPIIASASGTVQWAQYLGGFGNQVMINHGYYQGKSLMTSYNHLSRFAVSSGQSVSKGQVIGYSGTTGTSEACHLHFEVYLNGNTVNPMDYIG